MSTANPRRTRLSAFLGEHRARRDAMRAAGPAIEAAVNRLLDPPDTPTVHHDVPHLPAARPTLPDLLDTADRALSRAAHPSTLGRYPTPTRAAVTPLLAATRRTLAATRRAADTHPGAALTR